MTPQIHENSILETKSQSHTRLLIVKRLVNAGTACAASSIRVDVMPQHKQIPNSVPERAPGRHDLILSVWDVV